MDSSEEHSRHRELHAAGKGNSVWWKRAQCVPDTGGRPGLDDRGKDEMSGIRWRDVGRSKVM